MKSILFIEASPDRARLPKLILGRSGYRIHAVREAQEALVTASAEPPDLILVDAVDGGPEGRDLIRALRGIPALAGTPLLAFLKEGADPFGSGEVSPGPEEAPDAPAGARPDEIVRHPVNPFELLAKVRFLLNEEGRRPPPRLALRREAVVEAGEIHATGSLINLSGSGALVETEVAGVLEGSIQLRFSLPRTNRIFEPVGRVVRRSAPEGGAARIAVEFVEMDPESRRALESFLFLTG
jgi:CheY-like chemotaxis protein